MDFWEIHGLFGGLFLCLMCVLFPRITLAFLALIFGVIGVTFWGVLGWVLVPRLTIAVIATYAYWNTNPILCVLAWMCAFGGECKEKLICVRFSSPRSSAGVSVR